MTPSPNIAIFLDAVCREIKYKKIHNPIKRELSEHITDQTEAYLVKGISQEEATYKAIQDMGDPILIGQSLNKTHRPRVNWTIIILISAIILLNSCFFYFRLFNNTFVWNGHSLFMHYIFYVPIGLLIFLFFYFLDYTLICRHIVLCYTLYIIGMICFILFSPVKNGGYLMAIHPALFFIPLFATIIYRLRYYNYKGIIVSLILFLPGILVIYETSFYYPVYIVTCSCMFLLLFSIKKDYIHVNSIVKKSLKYITLLILIYIGYRIYSKAVIFSHADQQGLGYLYHIIRETITNAKPFGSVSSISYLDTTSNALVNCLPGCYSSHFLLFFLGKLGYIPTLFIMAVLLIFIYELYKMMCKLQKGYGYLLSASCLLIVIIQILTSILSNIGVIFSFRSVVPFLSYDATSFVVNMALLGLSLSIYRRSHLMPERNIQSFDERITYKDGKLTIHIKKHIVQ
ncbi:hypothetical protein HZI73_11310 [Vallitalea pronyensis]|uniref:Uncharacterized protein n=1 Tax=Vallitalea pronyensis TaxID=1348613 RepID=A0A8J8SGQ1_9FIRM|nr:permease prefix domain 1-containing protein [Vallitalea pronyensis]QUI22841.1 hypothetical protein HZI73_11310 [Vallitalea pronyensis]